MPRSQPGNITLLLSQMNDPAALENLIQFAYGELHRMSVGCLRMERREHTLQPTALLNETWMRLTKKTRVYKNRSYFFGAAVRAMRRILVEHARKRQTQKRGDGWHRVHSEDIDRLGFFQDSDLLEFDALLARLEAFNPRWSQVVELHIFGGLFLTQAARILGVSEGTVRHDWSEAKKWLRAEMTHHASPGIKGETIQ